MSDRVALERQSIALMARGLLATDRVAQVPCIAFTGAPRLLAWTCAGLGRGSFARARLMLVTVPRLDLELDVWTELLHDTEGELGLAEQIDTLDPRALDRLLADDFTDEPEDDR